MKKVNLKDVMRSLRVVVTDDGYELHNAAGTAKYDQWGSRCEVNGIPEYFPLSFSLDGKEKIAPTPTRNAAIEESAEAIIGNAIKKREGFMLHKSGCIHYHAPMFLVGEALLPDAFIDPGAIHKAKIQNKPGEVNITMNINGTATGDSDMAESIRKSITEEINKALRPGGSLHQSR